MSTVNLFLLVNCLQDSETVTLLQRLHLQLRSVKSFCLLFTLRSYTLQGLNIIIALTR